MTVLYALDVSGLADKTAYETAYAKISPQRKEKADRLKRPEARQRSVGAGLLLNKVTEFPYKNLSHSGKYAICVASDHPVGCDVERINPEVNLGIADRFFAEEEKADLHGIPKEERVDRFFRYWTLKESFMKCLGLGLALVPYTFSISLEDRITVTQTETDKDYYFREYADLPGYKCSVCIEGAPCDASLILLENEWEKQQI